MIERRRYLFLMQGEGGYRRQLLFSCCWLLVGFTLPWLVQLKKHFVICANMTISGNVARQPAVIVYICHPDTSGNVLLLQGEMKLK